MREHVAGFLCKVDLVSEGEYWACPDEGNATAVQGLTLVHSGWHPNYCRQKLKKFKTYITSKESILFLWMDLKLQYVRIFHLLNLYSEQMVGVRSEESIQINSDKQTTLLQLRSMFWKYWRKVGYSSIIKEINRKYSRKRPV